MADALQLTILLLVSSAYGALSDLKTKEKGDDGDVIIDEIRTSDYDQLMKLCKEDGEPMFIVHFGLHKENSCADTKERGDSFSLALHDFCCPPHWCNNAKLKAQLCKQH